MFILARAGAWRQFSYKIFSLYKSHDFHKYVDLFKQVWYKIRVACLNMLIAVVVPFTLTMILGKRKGIGKEAVEKAEPETVQKAVRAWVL